MIDKFPDYIRDYLNTLSTLNDNDIQKLLTTSATHGYEHLLCTLVDRCHINQEDCNYERALCLSAKHGHLSVVKCLSKKASKESLSEALIWSANAGQLDIVKYLVEQGADIHIHNNSALRCNAFNNDTTLATYLIEHGANIHANDDYALRLATRHSNKELIQLLTIRSIYGRAKWRYPCKR